MNRTKDKIKTIYYFEFYHSDCLYNVEQYIAENEIYTTEQGLINIQENEIGVIEDFEYLKEYCKDYGYDYEELLEEYKDE